jgi:recombination protein RecT
MSNIVTANNSTPSLKRFNQTITDVKTQDYLQQVLGERKSSFTNNIVALVANNTKLQECDPMSLMYSAIKATSLELPIDANLGFAYFIPYKNNARGITEAQFQMGYKGFVQLAMRSGKYKTINVADVREGELKHQDLLTGELQFEIVSNREKKTVIGYVAFFELINGFRKCLYMTTDEVKAHAKQYSKTYSFKDALWNTNFDGMARKTVLKLLLSKYGILSIEMQDAVKYDQAVIRDENGTPSYVDNTTDIIEDIQAEIIEEQGVKKISIEE